MGCDTAFENFEVFKKEIESYISQDINESETRSKLIDSLLVNVLGWSEQHIKREEKLDSGYYDYFVSIPGFSFIIEAKRCFHEFELPVSGDKLKIKTLLKSNQKLFDQLRSYCLDKGCPYGVLTNGKQYILTKLFNIDSTDWHENECLIFRSIEDIDNKFVSFFNNLSFEALVKNGTFNYISTASIIDYKTITSTIVDRDEELIRNSLSSELSPIIDQIFGDLFSEDFESDIDFIKKCFVENQETKKNREDIHRLFADKAPQLQNINPTVNTKNLSEEIIGKIVETPNQIRNLTPPKPIIIIGTKGAGKSTFINYLFNYRENEILKDNNIVATVDLINVIGVDDYDEKSIAKEIFSRIDSNYPELQLHSLKTLIRIYYDIIKKKDDGVWSYIKANDYAEYQKKLSEFLEESTSDLFEHLRLLNLYLIKERRKRIVVVIDNADQFPDVVQEKVYLFAHTLAKKCYLGTIISLREGYYYKWRNSKPFDAYISHVYHITAPIYSEVLSKRINYSLEKKMPQEGQIEGADKTGKKYQLHKSDVYNFLLTLNNSLFSEKQSDIIDFLNYTTHPNIREGLRVFNNFLTSGHTNIESYIIKNKFENSKDTYKIPIHEFVKSIALYNKLYYHSENSTVKNLFQIEEESPDIFIKFYILLDLMQNLDIHGQGSRFAPISTIIENFTSLGYKTKHISAALEKLLEFNMIDSDNHYLDIVHDGLTSDGKMAITSKGYYYVKILVTKFHYLDAVLQDTPILIPSAFEKIRSEFPLSDKNGKRDLEKRFNSVVAFVEYLFEMDKKQPPQVLTKFGHVSRYILSGLETDLKRIKGFLKN